jgi:hypothetical protein
MKAKRVLIVLILIIVLFIIFVWGLFNTSVGNNLVKLYFQYKVNNYFPEIKIDKFKVDYNNFFMILRDGKNSYKLYGQIHPFDAILEGNVKEIKIANKIFKENFILKGQVIKKNNEYLIDSLVYFDKYVGSLKEKLGKNKIIKFKSNNIDLNYFKNKFSIKIPGNVNAKANLDVFVKNNRFLVKVFLDGLYKRVPFKGNINLFFANSTLISFKGLVKSKILDGKFKGQIINEKFIYNADFDTFDLNLLKLIYPFKGKIYLKITKDKSGIIKFLSNYFSGFKDKKLNIEFNMDVDKFFYYLNLYNVFKKGKVIGRMLISDKGSFNFIIKNAILKTGIAKKLKLNNNIFGKIFVKGYFNSNYVIFDLLADNKNNAINIKSGKIIIKPKIYGAFIIIVNKNKTLYFYKFFEKKLTLLKKESLVKENNQILVY